MAVSQPDSATRAWRRIEFPGSPAAHLDLRHNHPSEWLPLAWKYDRLLILKMKMLKHRKI